MTVFLTAALLPVTWVIIQRYAARPLENLARKVFSDSIADALTKKRFE